MHYDRTVRPPAWLDRLNRAVFVLCVSGSVALWMAAPEPLWARLVATVLIVGIGGVIGWVHGRVTVDDRALTLAVVPLFRRRISLDRIVAVETVHADPVRDFGGYGYRLMGSGLVGFVFQAGPAAKLSTRYGRTYVVATPEADRLVELLRGSTGIRGE
ncbi:hypothetical protein ACFS2C_18345 [Prauserella oleivorans]|uniref:PH (Pleckstrin Homology) domain-containing protein n=1 Tax=Prauserella oleivorans TaxID=1478153 RepID=A0ABW5WG58_9PSEU